MMKVLVLVLAVSIFVVADPWAGRGAESAQKYRRTVEKYTVPDVTLVNQNGKKVRFRSLVDAGKPVLLDFIYGTCTTICPVLSAGFSNFQRRLGQQTTSVQLISISIDPENDTPEVLKEYLDRYRAKAGWEFLTGTREAIDQVMRAFDAYVPNKMAHYPVTLLRGPRGDRWIRIYGLVGTSDLMEEYQKVLR